jgi:DNA-binding MarR family transcriptional regulator
VGELAVLRIVADEWSAHGACDRSLKELAARAGVCRSLAKQTVKLAEIDGLITVQRRPRSGRKHLTSIIHIVRAEWLTWLDTGNRKAAAIRACHKAKPDFKRFRGVNLNPPRSQSFRKVGDDRVDKTVKKGNRTVASRS